MHREFMRRLMALILVAPVAMTARAGVHIDVGLGLIPPPLYAGPPPVYYTPPPPVYYGPGVVYGDPDWDYGGDGWRAGHWDHQRWHGDRWRGERGWDRRPDHGRDHR
jgi:hypothetical protein